MQFVVQLVQTAGNHHCTGMLRPYSPAQFSRTEKNEIISSECRYCLARLETVDHALRRRCPAFSVKRKKRLLPDFEHNVFQTQDVQEDEKATGLFLDFIRRKGLSQAREGEADTSKSKPKADSLC